MDSISRFTDVVSNICCQQEESTFPTVGICHSLFKLRFTSFERPYHRAEVDVHLILIEIIPRGRPTHADGLILTQHFSGNAISPGRILHQSSFATGIPELEYHGRVFRLSYNIVFVSRLDTEINASWRRQHVEGPDGLGGSQHDRRESELLSRTSATTKSKAIKRTAAAPLQVFLCLRIVIVAAEAVWVLDKTLGHELIWLLVIQLITIHSPGIGDESGSLWEEIFAVLIVLGQRMWKRARRDGTPAKDLFSSAQEGFE